MKTKRGLKMKIEMMSRAVERIKRKRNKREGMTVTGIKLRSCRDSRGSS
jgi:hypothetical protein